MTTPPKNQFEWPDGDEDEGAAPESPIGDMPVLAPQTDVQQIRHLVTPLRTLEQQVGAHVVAALQTQDTVAVVTAVVNTPEGQRIISAALNPDQMARVQEMLGEAAQQRAEEIPCVGFHCYIRPKGDAPKAQGDQSPPRDNV
jgi:hypothetical protein